MLDDIRVVSRDEFCMAMTHTQFVRLSMLTGRYGQTIFVALEPPTPVESNLLQQIGVGQGLVRS